MSDPVRVVVFKDAGAWVAQCLEYDICAQASSIDALRDRLAATIELELEESLERTGTPFGGIDPAPQRFFQMWNSEGSQAQEPVRLQNGGPEVTIELARCA